VQTVHKEILPTTALKYAVKRGVTPNVCAFGKRVPLSSFMTCNEVWKRITSIPKLYEIHCFTQKS